MLDAVEAASTQNSGDDGAGCACVTEAHIAAAGVSIYSHFGDERNADASGNHSKQAAELAALEQDARRDAGMRAGGDAEVPEAVAVAQHDEGFSAEIFERKRFGSGAEMFAARIRPSAAASPTVSISRTGMTRAAMMPTASSTDIIGPPKAKQSSDNCAILRL